LAAAAWAAWAASRPRTPWTSLSPSLAGDSSVTWQVTNLRRT
jgi:hypothetical protein